MSGLRVEAVRKARGRSEVLRGLDLAMPGGRILALLGPSGCGKTTLLRLLAGFDRCDAGTIAFGGSVLDGAGIHVPPETRGFGYVPQEGLLFPHLSVAENVGFGLSRAERRGGRIDEILRLVGLEDVGDVARRQPHQLSGGQQQRVALARALAPRPRLVLLDEPTTGLDVDARTALWAAVRGYCADGGTVVLTSHYLEEVQQLAERVVVVAEGRVLVDDTVDAVIAHVDVDRVTMHSPDRAVGDLAGVTDCHWTGDRVEVLTPDADAFVRSLVASGVEFSHLRVQGASLEDAFTQLTRHQSAAPAEEAHA